MSQVAAKLGAITWRLTCANYSLGTFDYQIGNPMEMAVQNDPIKFETASVMLVGAETGMEASHREAIYFTTTVAPLSDGYLLMVDMIR